MPVVRVSHVAGPWSDALDLARSQQGSLIPAGFVSVRNAVQVGDRTLAGQTSSQI